jgi:hypothetical protein
VGGDGPGGRAAERRGRVAGLGAAYLRLLRLDGERFSFDVAAPPAAVVAALAAAPREDELGRFRTVWTRESRVVRCPPAGGRAAFRLSGPGVQPVLLVAVTAAGAGSRVDAELRPRGWDRAFGAFWLTLVAAGAVAAAVGTLVALARTGRVGPVAVAPFWLAAMFLLGRRTVAARGPRAALRAWCVSVAQGAG